MSGRAAPTLTAPRDGEMLNPGLNYAKQASARNQAAAWNGVLVDDPVLGPCSGHVVDVGPRTDGRWPLVWRSLATDGPPF